LYVISEAERVKIIYDHLVIILSRLIFLSLLVLTVSAIGLASATSINILERTREIGIMRAIGATPRSLSSIFKLEGLYISIFSIVLGLIITLPFSAHASQFFGRLMHKDSDILGLILSAFGLAITVLFTILFAWLASTIPAKKAIKVKPRIALSYE